MNHRIWVPLAACMGLLSCQRADRTESHKSTDEPNGQPLRSVIIGAGSVPADYQVSIQQDAALAATVFPRPIALLFGGGHGSQGVQVERQGEAKPSLRTRLGDLFAPRPGRNAEYLPVMLPGARPATKARVLKTLRVAVASGTDPLFVYISGHGNQGATPAQNTIALWGQSTATVAEVADALAGATRPVATVVTTCFGGGFAELVARDVGPPQCGLFASTWKLPADGCDPNPERRAQQGYGVHFLPALKGQGRAGEPAAVDTDGDGKVSLLEAHSWTIVASRSANIPTTTSERWLDLKAPPKGPKKTVNSPELDSVIAGLGKRIGVTTTGTASADLLKELDALARTVETAMSKLTQQLNNTKRTEGEAYRMAAAEVLATWPILDDPWHPAFETTLTQHREAIETHIKNSDAYASYAQAVEAVLVADRAVWQLQTESAPLYNLVRAVETRMAASRLHHLGGPDWDRYEALLNCERLLPGSH